MYRILFIHDESYMDRALRQVTGLFNVERRCVDKSKASDLLAVIVLPIAEMPGVLSMGQTCSQVSETHGQTFSVFRPDSISLSGVWLLLTISEPQLLSPMPRYKVLSQALNILENRGCFRTRPLVFPVFLGWETKESMAKQLASLGTGHLEPIIPAAMILNGEKHSWKIA